MKRSLLALGLALTSLTGFADTSATLNLKGIIPLNLEISIAPTQLAETLDLTRQVSNEKVATVTEKSNSWNGYKVKAKSNNGGKLVNANDVNKFVQYQLTYNGSNMALNQSATEIYSTQNLRGTYNKDVKISYSQPNDLSAGTYSDVIQFTIEAN